MNIIFASLSRMRRYVLVLPGVLALCCGAHAENLQVSTTIRAGHCDVRIAGGENTPGVIANEWYVLELGGVNPADVEGGGVANLGTNSAVTLYLSCKGAIAGGGGDVLPVITVSGSTVGTGAVTSYLFREAGPLTTIDARMGAVLSKSKGTGLPFQLWNTGDYLKSGDTLTLSKVTGQNADGVRTTVYAGLSCGDATSCNAQGGKLTAGTLDAPIRFRFEYR